MKFKNKQAAHDYLKNSKVWAGDKSKEVQKVLYEYGFHWHDSKDANNSPLALYISDEFLDGTNDYSLFFTNMSKDVNSSVLHFYINKELFTNDILSIEIEQEKHEFKPFDKVLVSKDNSCWNPEFFKCYGYGGYNDEGISVVYYMSISGYTYTHCIPYEGNEELVFKTYNNEDKR